MKGQIYYDGYRFKSEGELKRYLGLLEFVKSGRLTNFEVYPIIPLIVNNLHVVDYSPTFQFKDNETHRLRFVQVLSRSPTTILELKMKLFEAIYAETVERWGDG